VEKTLRVLDEMKRAKVIEEYAVGDAIAALFYVEPFETHDLDVFISIAPSARPLVSLELIYSFLTRRGGVVEGEGVTVEGVPVQFLVPGTALEEEAIREARSLQYEGQLVRVMTPEYLLAIMIQLNRPKDRFRVTIFLEQCEIDRVRLASVLERHGLKEKWKRVLKELGVEEDRS
jgi:hypothetical protein